MSVDSGQINGLLQRWVKGDHEALDAVAPRIYQELRRLAHYHLNRSERITHCRARRSSTKPSFN